MTLDLFAPPLAASTIEEKIATCEFRILHSHIPSTDDRWVCASNLQKAIRRGLADTAIGTAVKLLDIDARYFWRRLLVIAYEDVGFGDVALTHTVLKTFRREALHKQLGAERVAAYLVEAMCNARKSRTLCDAIAMLEFDIGLGELEKQCFDLTNAELVNAICSDAESPMHRVAALRHICGYREQVYGSYRSITPARPELMREVCRRLSLTDMETSMFLSGQSVSEGMNIAIPLVVQLVRGEQTDVQGEAILFEGKNGILYAALDRHTRLGKRCYARLAREVEAVASFFHRHHQLDPVAALGVAVFIVEGSKLNRWVAFPQSGILRQTFEANFLEHAGVTGDSASELLNINAANLHELNRIRAEAM